MSQLKFISAATIPYHLREQSTPSQVGRWQETERERERESAMTAWSHVCCTYTLIVSNRPLLLRLLSVAVCNDCSHDWLTGHV